MLPVHQTIFGDVNGNCLQAALASVLELSLEDVPNVIASESWWDDLRQWLRGRGMELLPQPAAAPIPNGYYFWVGKGPRGLDHIVVAHGTEMVHDPHPDGTGLVIIEAYWELVGESFD